MASIMGAGHQLQKDIQKYRDEVVALIQSPRITGSVLETGYLKVEVEQLPAESHKGNFELGKVKKR